MVMRPRVRGPLESQGGIAGMEAEGHGMRVLDDGSASPEGICRRCPLPPVIAGEKVVLTAPDPLYADELARFSADEEAARGTGEMDSLPSPDAMEAVISVMSCDGRRGHDFLVWDARDMAVIGRAHITDMHPVHRSCEIGLSIGERAYRGSGRGTDTVRCLLRLAFGELGAENVGLEVADYNLRAIACYRKCGFSEYGRRHRCLFVAGAWHDNVLMEITREMYIDARGGYAP